MENTINIVKILKKHTITNPVVNWQRNGKFELTNYKAAIKEIVEQVLKLAADKSRIVDHQIDESSITNVINQIDFS